jgi:hypothetical protein
MRFLLGFFIGLFASTSLVSAQPVTANRIPAKVRYLCRGDYLRLCATVIPGDGRLVACIKKHRAEISPTCRQALLQEQAKRQIPRLRAGRRSRLNQIEPPTKWGFWIFSG